MFYFQQDVINKETLNEAYYGKNPLLLDCEKRFETIIKILKKNKVSEKFVKATIINKDVITELNCIADNIKELFGFVHVSLMIEHIGCANAFTFSSELMGVDGIMKGFINPKKMCKGKYGIMYTKESNMNLICVITAEMILVNDLTPGELVAVLLHEIGHNFYFDDTYLNLCFRTGCLLFTWYKIFDYCNIIANCNDTEKRKENKITSILSNSLIIPSKIFQDSVNKMYESISKTKQGKEVISVFSSFSMFFNLKTLYLNTKNFFEHLTYIFKNKKLPKYFRLAKYFDNLPYNPITLDGYKNEKFADSFASSYGYAPETITVQSKITKEVSGVQKVLKDSIIFKPLIIFDDFENTLYNINYYFSDPHPEDYTRCMLQLKYLEAQLPTIKDNKTRDCLKKDIEQTRKNLEKFNKDYIKNVTVDNVKIFTGAYHLLLRKIFGGDIRELLPFYKTNFEKDFKKLDVK